MLNYVRYYINEIQWRFTQKGRDFYNVERRYGNGIVHTANDANVYIADLIVSGKPFMIGRFGSTESYAMKVYDLKIKTKYQNALSMMCNNSGFFPKEHDSMKRFVELMKESCQYVDMIAIWKTFMEEYYIKTAMEKNVYMTYLHWLEPWYSTVPWTMALAGKRVLVIHPFSDTIQSQYQKKDRIFSNRNILPEFELLTMKAVQTIAGEQDERFQNWFEALEWMEKEAMKMEFDIAIIGCGAYGFPLAVKLKKLGKQAIHMGGATQLLFGIKGKRWDNDPVVSLLYNEAWVRPGEQERPVRAESIEGGCYW